MYVSTEPKGDDPSTSDHSFIAWCGENEARLRAALVSEFGPELGREAAAEALGYVWEHRTRVLSLENPAGYAFRVGQRWGRRQRTRQGREFPIPDAVQRDSRFEPALLGALVGLPTRQRQVVVLCIGFGLTHAEAAALLGISRSSVQNHAERGLRRLQQEIGS